jgi:hypothetical protein
VMNPKPLDALNHFTVPIDIGAISPSSDHAGKLAGDLRRPATTHDQHDMGRG